MKFLEENIEEYRSDPQLGSENEHDLFFFKKRSEYCSKEGIQIVKKKKIIICSKSLGSINKTMRNYFTPVTVDK